MQFDQQAKTNVPPGFQPLTEAEAQEYLKNSQKVIHTHIDKDGNITTKGDESKEAKEEKELPKCNIDSDEIVKYHVDTMLNSECFSKKYVIKHKHPKISDLEIILRTRSSAENDSFISYVVSKAKADVDATNLLNTLHLAYALKSFNGQDTDTGDMNERIARIKSMPTPKKLLLWDYLDKFDRYVEDLRQAYLNFS